jgi:hypothetical protein
MSDSMLKRLTNSVKNFFKQSPDTILPPPPKRRPKQIPQPASLFDRALRWLGLRKPPPAPQPAPTPKPKPKPPQKPKVIWVPQPGPKTPRPKKPKPAKVPGARSRAAKDREQLKRLLRRQHNIESGHAPDQKSPQANDYAREMYRETRAEINRMQKGSADRVTMAEEEIAGRIQALFDMAGEDGWDWMRAQLGSPA